MVQNMKRKLRVYKKTVSIVRETSVGMYENLLGAKRAFCWRAMTKIMTAIPFLEGSRRK